MVYSGGSIIRTYFYMKLVLSCHDVFISRAFCLSIWQIFTFLIKIYLGLYFNQFSPLIRITLALANIWNRNIRNMLSIRNVESRDNAELFDTSCHHASLNCITATRQSLFNFLCLYFQEAFINVASVNDAWSARDHLLTEMEKESSQVELAN